MNEVQRIADEIRRAVDGDPWHGPPAMRILQEVDFAVAGAHPLQDGHSIWEIVLHMTAWAREVHRRLGDSPPGEPLEGDWPTVGEMTAEAWRTAVGNLRLAHQELLNDLEKMPESRLWEIVGGESRDRAAGTGIRFYVMLHGLVQHDAYHVAQIATLRKVILEGPATG